MLLSISRLSIWTPVFLLLATQGDAQSTIVQTNSGRIQGFIKETPVGEIIEFMGIPYAKPPVGEGRFARPQPAEGWGEEPLPALSPGPACWQSSAKAALLGYSPDALASLQYSEDCLHVNVYVPGGKEISQRDALAVIVWIPGKTYDTGAAALGKWES